MHQNHRASSSVMLTVIFPFIFPVSCHVSRNISCHISSHISRDISRDIFPGKILKAKSCLEDGWRLLFLPQRDAMYGVSDVLADDGGNLSRIYPNFPSRFYIFRMPYP